ncbi:MAG: vitamin K epoxide reductase family protein [Longimicrobiales bacterium]
MEQRGVTRPVMDGHGEGAAENRGGERRGGMGEMTPAMRERMLEQHHDRTLWVHLTVVALGFWLMTSPLTFGYQSAALLWSDILSGALLVVFGALSFAPRRTWAPWGACFVGIWLQFAPLVFWAPTAAAYINDTVVGALVIALTVLIPGMPGMIRMMEAGPEIPPGWTYNPSSWPQRAPIIALGFVGWFASRYLAAYQLGYIDAAWDPFFGGGTMQILDSEVSRAWPISDAGLGAAAYTFEALMGYMGGTSRWRTMPWMVTFFGILVVPLGVVSIMLVIMQPVMVGTWCTVCLFTALAMLIMIPLTVDEVVAMAQFLTRNRREGKPFWRTFWMGGTVEGGSADERSPALRSPPRRLAPAMVWGVTVPWPLLASALLGMYLMAAPALFGTEGTLADSSHLVGAVVTTTAVIAMAEVTRAARFLNVLLGVWIAIAPLVLEGASAAAIASGVVTGALIVGLSIPRGPVEERYGIYDRFIL